MTHGEVHEVLVHAAELDAGLGQGVPQVETQELLAAQGRNGVHAVVAHHRSLGGVPGDQLCRHIHCSTKIFP